jgi:hypothetical protein
MSELVRKIAVFVGSPSDVEAERKIVSEAVDDLNVGFGSSRNIVLEVKKWETHVWPGFGEDAQSVINARIGSYDIFIGIFWNRFGTPTSRAGSGSAEELERAYTQWKEHRRPSLMLYFRRSPADLSTVEQINQKQRLIAFRETLQSLGALVREYADVDEFRRIVAVHLIQELTELEKSAAVADLNDRVSRQEEKLNEQQESLQRQQHVINQLVTYSMAEYVYRHMRYIYAGKRSSSPAEYLFRKNPAFEHDLRFLRDHGYIEFIEIDNLRDGDNLVKKVDLTPVGNFYVELRGGTPKAK